MTTRQASPGTAPWVAILDETRSVTSVQWRTYFLVCGHVVAVRRNSSMPRAKFCKCAECPPLPAKAKRAKMTPAEMGRRGAKARNAKVSAEERVASARLGGVATARNTSAQRAARAAHVRAIAIEAATRIATGERLELTEFAISRDAPVNRLRAMFTSAIGMTWREAHRRAFGASRRRTVQQVRSA